MLLDTAKNMKATMADKIAAAESRAVTGAAGVKTFQNKMNTALTGSTSTLTNDPANFLFDSYDRHRADYLAKNPGATGAADGSKEGAKWEEMCGLLREQNKKMDEQTGAIEGLADASPNSPKNLRWAAMGQEDFFGIMRAGV